MSRIQNLTAAFLGLACMTAASLSQAASGKAAAETFAFKFQPKHPLVYSVKTTIKLTSYMSAGAQRENTTTTETATETRYKLRLTAMGDRKNGVTPVRYEPFDYESDSEARGPAGNFVNSVRGLEVKGTQNGITVMDTAREIGMSQAKGFKHDAIPLLLSGQMDFEDLGGIKEFHGDLPFIDFWQNLIKSQIGLFGIVFPDRALAPGDSWEAVVPLKALGQIKLDGDGLSYTNTLTRREDAERGGRAIATFKVAAPMRCHDLTGYIEQGGQSQRLNITTFERHATGTMHFDRERGVFLDGDSSGTATSAMTTLIQGRALTMRMEMRMSLEITLIADPQAAEAK